MRSVLIFLAIHLLHVSCKNEADPSIGFQKQVIITDHCLVDPDPIEIPKVTCDPASNNEDSTCKTFLIEEANRLSAVAKSWFPYGCNADQNNLFFHNADGQEIGLHFDGFRHKAFNTAYNIIEDCPNIETGFHLYCLTSEKASISFKSSAIGLNMELYIGINFRIESEQDIKSFRHLNIDGHNTTGESRTFFSGVISDDSPLDLIGSNLIFLEELQIVDRTFENVWTYESESFQLDFKIFYTRTEGIIGIQDKDGVMWVLNE